MCSLSSYRQAGRYGFMMNRDERRGRAEGDVTQMEQCIFPTDALAGGTWAGVNRQGLALGLLNLYQRQKDAAGQHAWQSRGGIIPQLLASVTHVQQLEAALLAMPLSSFQAFTLVAMDRKTSLCFTWTGDVLTSSPLEPNEAGVSFLSSSSVDTLNILSYRQRLFEEHWQILSPQHEADIEGSVEPYVEAYAQSDVVMNKTSINTRRIAEPFGEELCDQVMFEEALSAFHLYQPRTYESESVFMSREKTHTKSLLHISVADRSRLTYLADTQLQACHTELINAHDWQTRAMTYVC